MEKGKKKQRTYGEEEEENNRLRGAGKEQICIKHFREFYITST